MIITRIIISARNEISPPREPLRTSATAISEIAVTYSSLRSRLTAPVISIAIGIAIVISMYAAKLWRLTNEPYGVAN